MDVQKFSALMAKLRKDRGLTQKQAAQHFGVSDKSVSKWERGETMPDVSLFPEIAEFYGISIDDLMRGELSGLEEERLSKNSSTHRDNVAKKYGVLFAVADTFFALAFSAWLVVGFFTDNGWKNVIFSFVILVFTAGIAIGHAIFTKKNKASCKKYSLIVFFHFLAAAVLFITCSGLFARVSEIVSAGVIVAAVLAVYLCYLCRERKIVGLLIRFRADIIIVAVLIAAVYFFLPFSVLKAENPYFQIKITVWRALDTMGTVGTIPLFLLLLCSVAYTLAAVNMNKPSLTIFLSWLPPVVLTVMICKAAESRLVESYGENMGVGIIPTVAGPFLLYGLLVAVAVSFVLYRLSARTRKKVQVHDNPAEG